MRCLKIKNTKEFMQKFLMTEAFAGFLLMEARVDTFVSYTIDGRVRREFYAGEEREEQEKCEFAPWESLRPQVMQMVKGKRTPLLMKLVLVYDPGRAAGLLDGEEDAAGSRNFVKYLLCTIKYENGVLTLTGGISYQDFTMDKGPEKCWNQELCRLADEAGLEYEII